MVESREHTWDDKVKLPNSDVSIVCLVLEHTVAAFQPQADKRDLLLELSTERPEMQVKFFSSSSTKCSNRKSTAFLSESDPKLDAGGETAWQQRAGGGGGFLIIFLLIIALQCIVMVFSVIVF